MTRKNINNSNNNLFNSSTVDASRLKEELDWLKRRFHATNEELRHLLQENEETIPLSSLALGPGILECVCLHLEGEGYTPREISKRVRRSYTTITNTLRKAKKKPLTEPEHVWHVNVPLAIFSQRKRAPLQALVTYLHDEEKMRFIDIARALNRDPRNINATYREVIRK